MAQMRTYCYYTNDLRMNSHWTYNHPFLDDIFIPSFFLSFFPKKLTWQGLAWLEIEKKEDRRNRE